MKFVDFKKAYQEVRDEVLPEIDRVLSNGDLILRDDVRKFEKTLAEVVGSKYAVGLNSGTDALVLALEALGIGKGDEVITSGYTFWATVEAIIRVGAKPVLCDIGHDLLIDVDDLERKITNKTKCIIPVHIGGKVCDMKRIMEIADDEGLFVVEDSAQSLGAIKKPKGHIQTYSFYPAKVLGCYGDGGAITTNNKNIAEKIRILRDHGRKTKHLTVCVGYNSRLDNLQAAILNVKIKYLSDYIKRRNEIAEIYKKNLEIDCPESETYQEFNIQVQKRDGLYNYLKKNGVETLKGDYTFPMKQPKTVLLANKQVLRLPIFPTLTNEEIIGICKLINKYFKK